MVNPNPQTLLKSIKPGAQIECQRLISTLFHPTDMIEIRAIASSGSVVRHWFKAQEISSHFIALTQLNHDGFNIYFGVNPRSSHDGTKGGITLCRTVWADLDRVSVDDALSRCRLLPEPTAVVNSGHGAHLYWLLDSPVLVDQKNNRDLFEGTLKALYKELASDSTQDVSRLLRLPGFLNMKDSPVPCSLVSADSSQMVPIKAFASWKAMAEEDATRLDVISRFNAARFEGLSQDTSRVRGLLRTLDQDSPDRSRRDFWVVCQLFRIGLSAAEIQVLVTGHSKFTSEQYTDHTINRAYLAVFDT